MMMAMLCDASLRALLLGATMWALVRVLRITEPAQERVVWLSVLCAAMLLPVSTRVFASVVRMPTAAVALPSGVRDAFVAMGTPVRAGAVWQERVLRASALAYLCVAVVLLCRLALGLMMTWRLWRSAAPIAGVSTDNVPVRWSTRIDAPATAGRGVLLPANWPQWPTSVLRSVMAHEESHISRGDFFWQVLAHVYCAVFWVNPLSWWLLRRLTVLAEHLSDAAALRTQPRATDYASLLLDFSSATPTRFVTVSLARRSLIATRIDWILGAAEAPSPRTRHRGGVLTGMVGAIVVSLAAPGVRWEPLAAHASHRVAVAPSTARAAPPTKLAPLRPMTTRMNGLRRGATRLAALTPLATTALAPLRPSMRMLEPR